MDVKTTAVAEREYRMQVACTMLAKWGKLVDFYLLPSHNFSLIMPYF